MKDGNVLRAAIIGCGNIFTMHATPVSVMKNVELVGVCDVKKDRADTAAKKRSKYRKSFAPCTRAQDRENP